MSYQLGLPAIVMLRTGLLKENPATVFCRCSAVFSTGDQHDRDGIDPREMLGAAGLARAIALPAALGEHGRLAAARAEAVAGVPVDHRARAAVSRELGRIEGGTSVNTVPDRCQIEIDRRSLPGENMRSIHSDFDDYLRRQAPSGIDFTCAEPWLSCPALRAGLQLAEKVAVPRWGRDRPRVGRPANGTPFPRWRIRIAD